MPQMLVRSPYFGSLENAILPRAINKDFLILGHQPQQKKAKPFTMTYDVFVILLAQPFECVFNQFLGRVVRVIFRFTFSGN